jgi:NOL1/NOP2/sun family putative RNA methylase
LKYELPQEFLIRMERLLGSEMPAFLSAYETLPKRGLRVNTLKCGVDSFQKLFSKRLSPSPFASDGFMVEEEHRAGRDPLHHAGAYYMQEPSAMSAVTVLAPKPGERVLDLCAAPGGKSTQIAAALEGQGLLWTNEYVRARASILAQNLERCGVRNAVVSNTDATNLCRRLQGFFDAVLVDAPCSGEGMFRKEPAALAQWSVDNIHLCAKRQEEILWAAADAVGTGGRLAYSPCTFAPEENECLIDRFLAAHRDFKLVSIGKPFGRPGFLRERVSSFTDSCDKEKDWNDMPLEYTRRILPQDGGEGHFIALLVRDGEACVTSSPYKENDKDDQRHRFELLMDELFTVPPPGLPQTVGSFVRLLPEGLPALEGLGVLYAGVTAAAIRKNRLEPCHALYMAMPDATHCRSSLDLPLADPRLTAFLRGETVEALECTGWTAVHIDGIVTGFGKVSGGILKNHYPKGLRLLHTSS